MYIIAVGISNPETLLVEIPEEKINQLLKSFRNNFQLLVQSVDIINKELIVMKPVILLNNNRIQRSNYPK